eukprot:GHVS01080220.1.p1 GENE.GHVS01080220.1~~GHVS01080220.1.p1  ORF type:complete len:1024 (+),score=243.20 GHVS01080220.1:63-3134(+)
MKSSVGEDRSPLSSSSRSSSPSSSPSSSHSMHQIPDPSTPALPPLPSAAALFLHHDISKSPPPPPSPPSKLVVPSTFSPPPPPPLPPSHSSAAGLSTIPVIVGRPLGSCKSAIAVAMADDATIGKAEERRSSEEKLMELWEHLGFQKVKLDGTAHPREHRSFCSLVFFSFFVLEIFVNYDSGAIPAVLATIRKEFDLTSGWLGVLGALPYVGLILASPIVGRLLQRHSPKRVVFRTMLLNVVASIILTLSLHSWMLLFSRLLCGLTQAAFVIYAPVWVDEFAPKHKLALWMGLIQGATIIGVTIGYLTTGFMADTGLNWRWAVLVQNVALSAMVAVLCYLPSTFVDVHSHCSKTVRSCPSSNSSVPSRFPPSSSSETAVIQLGAPPASSSAPGYHLSVSPSSAGGRPSLPQTAIEMAAVSSPTSLRGGEGRLLLNRLQSASSSGAGRSKGYERMVDAEEAEGDVVFGGEKQRSVDSLVEEDGKGGSRGGGGRTIPSIGIGRKKTKSAEKAIIDSLKRGGGRGGANKLQKNIQKSQTEADNPSWLRNEQDDIWPGDVVVDRISTIERQEAVHTAAVRTRGGGGRISSSAGGRRRMSVRESYMPYSCVATSPAGAVFEAMQFAAGAHDPVELHEEGVSSASRENHGRTTSSSSSTAAVVPPDGGDLFSDYDDNNNDDERWKYGRQLSLSLVGGMEGEWSSWWFSDDATGSSGGEGTTTNTTQPRGGGVVISERRRDDDGGDVKEDRRGSSVVGEVGGPMVRKKHPSLRQSLRSLRRSPVYIWSVFTLCALIFVVTGVQFWATKYFTDFLQIEEWVARTSFCATAATAPTAGVLMGGFLIDRLGGYKSKQGMFNALIACTVASAMAVISGVGAGFLTTYVSVIACIWSLLFFGGCMLPPLTGILIAAVDMEIRTFASGFSMFLYNVFGYALGTFLPGVIMQIFNAGDVLGMRLILLWSIFGFLGVSIATLAAKRLHLRPEFRTVRSVERFQDNNMPQVSSSSSVSTGSPEFFDDKHPLTIVPREPT